MTESRPDLAAAWETLGLAAMDMGDGAEATRALETALGLDPDMLAATLGLARRYKALGNLEGASALLERLAERLPDSGDIQCELAHVYERPGPVGAGARAVGCLPAAESGRRRRL